MAQCAQLIASDRKRKLDAKGELLHSVGITRRAFSSTDTRFKHLSLRAELPYRRIIRNFSIDPFLTKANVPCADLVFP